MRDIITKEMQDAYWEEWQQTQDHWLALAEAIKAQPKQEPMDTAPKDGRRILIKTVTFGWSSDICQNVATGDKWTEARWGKDLSGKEEWLKWCGDEKTHTTEGLTPLAWAPVPSTASSVAP
ncbi:hypothetical protein [Rhizobium sullae]|uniref:hypothetical protein n=1 Tax=Rhizobium sullae TaxID=50338 RepID=UPI0012FDCA0E|nr:hypothetical protein [Rhizobium sullae]